MKVRKKSVEVEAVQWNGTNVEEIKAFVGKDAEFKRNGDKFDLIIHTLEGDHRAILGSYIIKGVEGEFYPCELNIFKKTYEIISESKIDSKFIEWCATHFTLNATDELTMNDCFIDIIFKSKTSNNLYLGYGLYCLGYCPKLLFEYDINKVEAYKDFDKSSSSRVACIGFSESKQGWLGWSHRACFFFKIGYVVEEGTLCTDTGYFDEYAKEHPEKCFNLPAGFVCKTLDDCRKCAIAYAMAVA